MSRRNKKPNSAFMDRADMAAEFAGCSLSHVDEMADRGQIPKPFNFGTVNKAKHLWRRCDFDAWLADGCKSQNEMAGASAQ